LSIAENFDYEYLREFEFKIEKASAIVQGNCAEPINIKNRKSISVVRYFKSVASLLKKLFDYGAHPTVSGPIPTYT
jgi:hypothetical protein